MSLEKVLLKINQWGAGAILIAPILMSSKFIFPFVQLKNIYFRGLILILMVSLAWYVLESGKLGGRRNRVFYAVALFGVVATVATFFGVNWQSSWWGNFERMDGLFNWWLLVVYLILLVNVFNKTKEWLWLFRVSILTATVTALLGLIQHGWLIYENEWSNIGNSAFLGLYMLLNVILGLVASAVDKVKTWRYFYIVTLIINVVALLGAASRAPIVGAVVGALVAAIFAWKGSSRKYKIIVGALAVAMVLAGSLVWLWRGTTAVKKVKFLSRLTNISREDATTNSRLLIWQSAEKSFMERPIFGYGPNNFAYGLNKYYDPRVEEQWFDRAHNFIFDYANMIGILGLLSYLTIFGAAFNHIYLIGKKDRIQGAILAGAVTAYLVTLMFVFDTINTWLPALLLLAFSGFYARAEENDKIKLAVPEGGYYFILAVVIGLAILGIYGGVIKPAKANLLAAEAYKYSVADYQKSLDYYRQALAVGGMGEREIVLQENRYILEALQNEQFNLQAKKAIFEQAEEDSLALLKKDPRELQVRMALAQTYLAYTQWNTFYAGETINLLKDNLNDSPKRVEMYFMLAQANVLKGDNEGAIDWLEKAYQASNEVEAVYENLIALYAHTKKEGELGKMAQEYINKFSNLNAEQYRKVGQYYFQIGALDKSENILREWAIPREPENWRSYVSLASIYEQKKEYTKAVEYLEIVLEEHPSWPADVRKTVSDYRDELASRQAVK